MISTRKPETGAEKIDEVSRNRVWKEFCDKEAQQYKLNDQFSITSPHRIKLLAEKPNKVVPEFVDVKGEDVLGATQELRSRCNTRHTHQMPSHTYSSPPTSNMTYGFQHMPLYTPHPMFSHKKLRSDVTAYAESYSGATNGLSPFSQGVTVGKDSTPVKILQPWQ